MPARAASVSRPCSGSCHSYTSQRSCLLFYGGLLGYFIGPNNPNLWARADSDHIEARTHTLSLPYPECTPQAAP